MAPGISSSATGAAPRNLIVGVVSHTHWDREWYLPFQQFRWKLVALIDQLLETLRNASSVEGTRQSDWQSPLQIADRVREHPDPRSHYSALLEKEGRKVPEFRCFMLDGQTILLEDYLELRPNRREELRRHIEAGRIMIGPWYVLPDEFLVSGEALIRNLLVGDRVAREFGQPMQVGYLPDQFGHIAQMPQLLRGFCFNAAVIWRGIGDELTSSEFHWSSPDGSQVFTLHLPTGYFNGQLLPNDPHQLAERARSIRATLEDKTASDYVLIMNGGDHQFVHRGLPAAIAAANEELSDIKMVHYRLPELLADIQRSLEANHAALPEIEGELRNSKRAHLLPGVLSSRIWIKQRNVACENLLERWAEPMNAWSSLENPTEVDSALHDYGQFDRTSASTSLRLAWKYLLQNHPHDSICGCSVDQVHDEMVARFNWSEGLAEGVARQGMERLAAHIDTLSLWDERGARAETRRKRAVIPQDESRVQTADPHSTIRPGAVTSSFPEGEGNNERCVVVFNPVGGPRTDYVTVTLRDSDAESFAVLDDSGRKFPCQVVAKRTNPVNSLPEVDLGFIAHNVPGHGYKAFRIAVGEPVGPYRGASISCRRVENEHFVVEVDGRDGTLRVLDKAMDNWYEGLNHFVDGGDAGDEYNYDAPRSDTLVDDCAEVPRITAVETGPCKYTLKVQIKLMVPRELAGDRQSRSFEKTPLPITSFITLYPDVARVDVHTEIGNWSKDHRLRAHFPTGVGARYSYAETQFGVEKRPVELPEHDEQWIETPVGTFPQKGFVDVNDGTRGLTVANRGLPEYEALRQDSSRGRDGLSIALTLLRGVGWLSRDDLRSRRGPAGPVVPAPGGQCWGKHSFDYAIIPHRAGWQQASARASDFASPMRTQIAGVHRGKLPAHLSLIEVQPEELAVSAIKLAEHGDGVIVRLYNRTTKAVRGKVNTHRAFDIASLANLREEPQQVLARYGNSVEIEVGPAKIVTLRFEFPRISSYK